MPIYEYIAIDQGCEHCLGKFTELESLSAEPLNTCPQCGAAVQRLISAPHVVGGNAQRLKESHIEKHGFTQYKRVEKGKYEKTAGRGPNTISDD